MQLGMLISRCTAETSPGCCEGMVMAQGYSYWAFADLAVVQFPCPLLLALSPYTHNDSYTLSPSSFTTTPLPPLPTSFQHRYICSSYNSITSTTNRTNQSHIFHTHTQCNSKPLSLQQTGRILHPYIRRK